MSREDLSVSRIWDTEVHMRIHLRGAVKSEYKLHNNFDAIFITETRPCNIQRFFTGVKNDNFHLILFYYFHIFAQNIDRGYTLEPPQ